MTQPLPRDALRRVAALFGILSITLSGVLGLTAVTASANPTLDAETRIDCDTDQSYADEGDADLAEDLADDGYTCTALLNKGPINSSDTIDKVGELWFLNDGGDLSLKVIIFDGDNDDFDGDAKVCVDDDGDPINDIDAGGDAPLLCEGKDDVLWKIDAGDTVPSAADDEEDEGTSGNFEGLIDGVEGSEGDLGGFDVDINDFTEVVIHFNAFEDGEEDSTSIVAFFQPGGDEDRDSTTPGVTWQEPDCDNENTAGFTGTNDDFDYEVTDGTVGPGNTVTVTATLKDGVEKDVEGTTTFEHTFGAAETECGPQAQTTTASVSFQDPTCSSNSVGWTGTNTEELTYTVTSGSAAFGEAIESTATVKEGVDKTLTGDTVFTHTFGDRRTGCGSSSNSSNNNNNNNNNSTTTTTAAPAVLAFTPEPEMEPEVLVAPTPAPAVVAAPAPELPFTGSDSGTLAMWAVGLLGLGSLLILGSRKKVKA